MTTISATVVADSIAEHAPRLTTLQLRYPRFLHSELMTHRVFARNARSSRAVPVKKMIEEVRNDPVIPIHWGKNQPGMQAREDNRDMNIHYTGLLEGIFGDDPRWPEEAWKEAADFACDMAEAFAGAGYHKQIVNRILEPFLHIDVLVTSTSWANFLALRDHPDAEPHIALLAQKIRQALDSSIPNLLRPGEWHLPYANTWEDLQQAFDFLAQQAGFDCVVEQEHVDRLLLKASAARCARISYKPFDAETADIAKDVELHDRLVGAQPLHASPAEHQATPDIFHTDTGEFDNPSLAGCLGPGWIQYRKTLLGEFVPG